MVDSTIFLWLFGFFTMWLEFEAKNILTAISNLNWIVYVNKIESKNTFEIILIERINDHYNYLSFRWMEEEKKICFSEIKDKGQYTQCGREEL